MAKILTIKFFNIICGTSISFFIVALFFHEGSSKMIIENRREIVLSVMGMISAMFSIIYVLAKRDKLVLENRKRELENEILEEELKGKKILNQISELEYETKKTPDNAERI